ncbi:tagaturonate reductase [Segetibacter aerophilus]|uniref:Altronate oxidoreductase n=1 Tax=Segetibacter aerophilus TaxID=670293 RepID=A0A512BDW0_9BACT|nr:tagaturonate reductase [Segetibacter aerophilus]GEO10143.1 altronate oxidoreductase [Segetibacter aerophilus]
MNLSRKSIAGISANNLQTPTENLFQLPEKVLQFGTGVLLRGLPDYFIDKANKQGVFNGRVVVVKSTSQGGTDAFAQQDNLFTQCIRGLEGETKIEENIINASISRVLSAREQWNEILECAENSDMEIIISNTTEVGISLVKDDKIDSQPPVSFPGKLLAFLYKRFKAFKGDSAKGMIIVPTELIVDNGKKLKAIVLELAQLNGAEAAFIAWLESANHFCDSLVDRIVPGKLPAADQQKFQQEFQYNDELMIMSESYSLWAIEAKDEKVKEKLSFYKTDPGVVIARDINKFRELKLRLLNGTHTLTCALAHLAGCTTVKEAMDDEAISAYVTALMVNEIAPAIVSSNLSLDEAKTFAEKVRDRFRNPFIEHKWSSISVQYSSKMKMRNVPILLKHYESHETVPQLIAVGFAAYIVFMNCSKINEKFIGSARGVEYAIQDDHAGWFAERSNLSGDDLVQAVLSDKDFWEHDLAGLPGFAEAVADNYKQLRRGEVKQAIKDCLTENVESTRV